MPEPIDSIRGKKMSELIRGYGGLVNVRMVNVFDEDGNWEEGLVFCLNEDGTRDIWRNDVRGYQYYFYHTTEPVP